MENIKKERTSSEVEKLAFDDFKLLLMGEGKDNIFEKPDNIIGHRVHKSRIKTKTGFINTGEDLFGLFDMIFITRQDERFQDGNIGDTYLVQVSDNLKRPLKKYTEFANTFNTICYLVGRVYDDGKNIIWRIRVLASEKLMFRGFSHLDLYFLTCYDKERKNKTSSLKYVRFFSEEKESFEELKKFLNS